MGDMTQLGLNGYLAKPAGYGPWPATVVIQEWWGLDQQTKSIADRFAQIGYLAFAPDLYHGELARLGDAQRATSLKDQYGPGAPAELEQVYDALKARPDCNGKIGSVGFCFGGRMSLELGLRRPLQAVCTFYGGGMQNMFDRLGGLRAPVLGLFGDQDQSIPVGTVQEFEKLLSEHQIEHEVKVYSNSGHAFFRDSDASVHKPEAAADAWERVKKFYAKYLG